MIKAIALDDELPALKIIQEYSSKVDFLNLEKTFTHPAEALKYLRKFPVDLVFLDIKMPSLSGIDFYKEIRQSTLLIFITAHTEYAVEGFNLNAIDYLLKPFSFERFLKAVKKASHYLKSAHQEGDDHDHLFIRSNYSLVNVAIKDILYIEGLGDYLKIHITNHKTLVAKMNMKTILDKLPLKEFLRVHRSFIVPLSKIIRVKKRTIELTEGNVPIGLSYEQKIMAFLKKKFA